MILIRLGFKLVYNLIIGTIALILLNLVGGYFEIKIALNAATALTAGTLGIPGIALLIVLGKIWTM